eukprot:6461826-Amphidinium_carterae.1
MAPKKKSAVGLFQKRLVASNPGEHASGVSSIRTSLTAAPTAKKVQSGLCKCSACGGLSKDKWGVMIMQDKLWALRKANVRTGLEVAEGDACEDCHIAWASHFSHMNWDEYASAMQNPDHELHGYLEDAKKCALQPSSKTWKPHQVTEGQACVFTLERTFLALTSGEVKKLLSLKKLTKSLVDGVPKVDMVTESGQSEQLYIFKDSEQIGRKLHIKMEQAQTLMQTSLPASSQTWTQQAQHVWQHASKQAMNIAGVSKMMNRDIPTLEEFLE